MEFFINSHLRNKKLFLFLLNPMTVLSSVPVPSSPDRSRSVSLLRLSWKGPQSRRPRIYIVSRVYWAWVYLLLLLFEFHGLVAAGNGAVAAAGYDHLSPALGADVSLSYGICHRRIPPS